jgi:gamma-glutamyltranspeptidase / glutathione hydrolase
LLEIMRRAQADRIYGVVDPDSMSRAQQQMDLVHLLDPERWPKRCPIEPNHATPNQRVVPQEAIGAEMEHTTHLAVVDAEGMAVSLTTTLSAPFGSKVITETGIVLNNALGSFSGKGQNQPWPNRRTTSSMAPAFVQDELGLRLILGTPGGDTIPSTLLQLVNSMTDYSVPLDEAIDAPRLHQSIASDGRARMESRRPIPAALQRNLARLGHRFASPTSVMGHANTIALIDGQIYGYADPREGGLALGWSAK